MLTAVQSIVTEEPQYQIQNLKRIKLQAKPLQEALEEQFVQMELPQSRIPYLMRILHIIMVEQYMPIQA